jgi:hypothetical protein
MTYTGMLITFSRTYFNSGRSYAVAAIERFQPAFALVLAFFVRPAGTRFFALRAKK